MSPPILTQRRWFSQCRRSVRALEAPKLLLDHGADSKRRIARANDADAARAAASDVGPDDALKALIANGVDVNARDKRRGETALDIARRHGRTPIGRRARRARAPPTWHRAGRAGGDCRRRPRRRARRSSGPCRCCSGPMRVFLKKSGCVSCHNNTLTAMTVAAVARRWAFAVDEATARASLKTIGDVHRRLARPRAAGRRDSGRRRHRQLHPARAARRKSMPADPATDAMAFFLKRTAAAERPVADHRAPAADRIERHRGDGGIDARAAALRARGGEIRV